MNFFSVTKYIFPISIFLLSISYNSKAQFQLPEFGPVFPQNEVSAVRITIDPDSLADMFLEENLYSDHEYPATFTFENSLLTETVENVGFRLRGNTSREAHKKSFKISINSFGSAQWQGLEKLNLNAYHNDPSLMRAKLCADMYREAGLPGSRTAYTHLYINDEFRGIYLNVEHIDEEFTARYFDQEGDGNLYKCLYPASLTYLGNDPNEYKVDFFGRRIYELKTNEWKDDYSDIASFISALENVSQSELPCTLTEIFDTETYLKYAALEVLQGHWDGYIYNQNNFYLCHHEGTGQLVWIPYDFDNTFGIDWFGENWSSRNPYHYGHPSEPRPLYERMMDTPLFRDMFSHYLQHYLDQFFDESWYSQKIQNYQDLLSPMIGDDFYYTLDYGYTADDFMNSATQAWGGHVTQGLNAYFTQRKLSAQAQIESAPLPQLVSYITDNGPSPSIPVVTAYAEGYDALLCNYTLSNGTEGNLQMSDDGVFPDVLAGDRIFSCFIDPENADFIHYQISVPGGDLSCETEHRLWLSPSPLTIQFNEIMSFNESFHADENGEYDDWIELFNFGSGSVNLSNMFLTDEIRNENKWALPAQLMQSGTFRLYWADDQPEQGNTHTSFGLSNTGESLWLYRKEQGAYRLVAGINFPALNANESFGRMTEASSEMVIFTSPTPNAPNSMLDIPENDPGDLRVFPNPATSVVGWNRMCEIVRLYDATGQLVLSERQTRQIFTGHLPAGMYTLVLDHFTCRIIIL